MSRTCIVAALPLILSLTVIPTAQAQPAHFGWQDAYGSIVVIPSGHADAYFQMREPRRFALPPAAAQLHGHVKDPFADLHFE